MKAAPQEGTVEAAVYELAKRPHGVKADEVDARNRRSVWNAIARLREQGLLFPAKVSHKVVRDFTTKEAAEAYLASLPAGRVKGPAKPAGVTIKPHRFETDEVREHEDGVKVTISKAPPPRFQTVELPTMRAPCTTRKGGEDFRQWQKPGRW